MIALPYVHMAAKYLLPGVPAAALLIVLHAARVRQPRYPLIVALLVALGWISGALIVVGDTTLASSQREAVNRLIAPRIRRGLKVWAGGQWAFLAYAEDAGARALANTPPLPEPGDTIVVSRLDYYGKLDRLPFRRELLNTQTDRPLRRLRAQPPLERRVLFHPLRLPAVRHRVRGSQRLRYLSRLALNVPP